MNKRMIVYIVAKMLGVEGVVLLLPAFVSWIYGEKNGMIFLAVSVLLIGIYLLFGRKVCHDERGLSGINKWLRPFFSGFSHFFSLWAMVE